MPADLATGAAASDEGGFAAASERIQAAQRGHLFPWVPICLLVGVCCYFALPTEPPAAVFVLIAVLAVALGWLARTRPRPVCIAMCVLLAGFCLARFRAEQVSAPLLPATTPVTGCTGEIEAIERRAKGRVVLTARLAMLDGVAARYRPAQARLSLKPPSELRIGQSFSAKCRLVPLPGPAMPGGFDFGRTLWFAGVGATGRVVSDFAITGERHSWAIDFAESLRRLRSAMGARIRQALDGDIAAIGEALITGERATIPDEVNTSFQISGLAHILSISGLHMSLVAGGVFGFVRGILALFPAIALTRPIKKWAAVAALLAGFGYMLLSGSEVATQRSYIMLAIMFLAVLLDRPALSLRNLALAAMLILTLEPEAALSASFQMSFMAVLGLVAFYDAWSRWRARREAEPEPQSRMIRWSRHASGALLLTAATTLVAGSFSSIPAAYHFGRLSPLSLVANLLALPVIGMVVMPAALVGVALMPLGLESWPLWAMGEGLKAVLGISDWVAGLPGARLRVPTMPLAAALVIAAGAIVLCLVQGWARLTGLMLMALGIAAAQFRAEADVLIERTAGNVAVRQDDGLLALANPRRASFAAQKWLMANGEDVTPAIAAARPAWSCADLVCQAEVKGKRIAYVEEGANLDNVCSQISILIARFPLRGACRDVPVRIDRFDVWRSGAHAVYISNGAVTVKTARAAQGDRPWLVRPVPRRDLDSDEDDAQ